MQSYFYSSFPNQLVRLSYAQPSEYTGKLYGLAGVPFFGGRDWKNVATDLATIPVADRASFVLALFMVVLTDQALYTYHRDAYEMWRKRTAFPKFAWTGIGVHNENPMKILWIPEREGLVDVKELIAAMPGFVEFLVTQTRRVFVEYGLPVSMEKHFKCIMGDLAYDFDQGIIVPTFKSAFEIKLASFISL
jgi:hypothetical protein